MHISVRFDAPTNHGYFQSVTIVLTFTYACLTGPSARDNKQYQNLSSRFRSATGLICLALEKRRNFKVFTIFLPGLISRRRLCHTRGPVELCP